MMRNQGGLELMPVRLHGEDLIGLDTVADFHVQALDDAPGVESGFTRIGGDEGRGIAGVEDQVAATDHGGPDLRLLLGLRLALHGAIVAKASAAQRKDECGRGKHLLILELCEHPAPSHRLRMSLSFIGW